MNADPFAPIDRKIVAAQRHFREMGQCLIHPLMRGGLNEMGYVIGTCIAPIETSQWQDVIWDELNSTLSCAYAATQIVNFRLGCDTNQKFKTWLKTLDSQSQSDRRQFDTAYRAKAESFWSDPLTDQRHVEQHRMGWANAVVRIDMKTECLIGDPFNPVPVAWCSSYVDPDGPPLPPHLNPVRPVIPNQNDFHFLSPPRPLFPECLRYIRDAENLVGEAKQIFASVYQGRVPATPPS
jgi:hypothetical protein